MCSRCLTNGSDCKYSPSSRAGKPKADAQAARHAQTPTQLSMSLNSNPNNTMPYSQQMPPGQQMILDFWNNQHSASIDLYGQPQPAMADGNRSPDRGAIQGVSMPTWPPNSDQYMWPLAHGNSLDNSIGRLTHANDQISHWQATQDIQQMLILGQTPMPTPPSNVMTSLPFTETEIQDVLSPRDINQTCPGRDYDGRGPQQHSTDLFRTIANFPTFTGVTGGAGSCECYATCVKALPHLNNASLELERVLVHQIYEQVFRLNEQIFKLNEFAVQACSYMLSCRHCMSQLNTLTGTSLAHIIVVVGSLYESIFHTDIRSFNAKEVEERFNKLQLVHQRFTEECMKLPEAPRSFLLELANSPLPSVDQVRNITSVKDEEDNLVFDHLMN